LLESALILIIAMFVGYMFGALPLAYRIGRIQGVDIFAEGTGLAGATNVRQVLNVYAGALVLLGDIGKGIMAIVCGRLLGVDDSWIILVGMAAVVGHWHSVFTGFRGGDGLATLGGITIALFLIPGFIAAVVASAVTLVAQKTPVTSLAGTVFGYITLVALGFAYELGLFPYEANLSLTLGVGALFAMVLARAFKSNLRLRRGQDFAEVSEEDMPDSEQAPDRSGL
jgi:glycerol-3-phosphate acyltransferase PlsY